MVRSLRRSPFQMETTWNHAPRTAAWDALWRLLRETVAQAEKSGSSERERQ